MKVVAFRITPGYLRCLEIKVHTNYSMAWYILSFKDRSIEACVSVAVPQTGLSIEGSCQRPIIREE